MSSRFFVLSFVCLFLSSGELFAQGATGGQEPSAPLPICGIVAGPDEWNSLEATPSLYGDTTYINRVVATI